MFGVNVMISIAMAAFNGERYIKMQLDSVFPQISSKDEVVVSLDPSKDSTLQILKEYQSKDNRLKILEGPSKGIVKNFENAIKNCKGDYIFLCDQDDVWSPSKIETVVNEFKRDPNIVLVIHDALITDDKLNIVYESFFEKNDSRGGKLKNIIKNSYIGCCMIFKKELKPNILPFPENLPMHDQWIGLVAEFKGKVKFLNAPLIKYRRHSLTATNNIHANFLQMLRWRYSILKSLISHIPGLKIKKN